MNIPYLLSILGTDELSELAANIDLPPLDLNIAIWESIDRGEIEVDEVNGKVKLLATPEPSSDSDLKNKILRAIQHYAREKENITRGVLNKLIKDPATNQGYGWHEYIMAVQHLIDGELIIQYAVDVPEKSTTIVNKKGKKKVKVLRPAHKLAFLGLAENKDVNEEWNANAVEKWKSAVEEAIANK